MTPHLVRLVIAQFGQIDINMCLYRPSISLHNVAADCLSSAFAGQTTTRGFGLLASRLWSLRPWQGERHSSMRTNGPAAEVLAKSAAFQIIVLVSGMSIAGADMMRPSI